VAAVNTGHAATTSATLLLRDAGGLTPAQSVWSNAKLRAEIGLGPRADEAAVRLLEPLPLTLQCRRA